MVKEGFGVFGSDTFPSSEVDRRWPRRVSDYKLKKKFLPGSFVHLTLQGLWEVFSTSLEVFRQWLLK